MTATLVDWVLHLDVRLGALAASHGTLVYLALFSVIFIETGVVVLPFLPGDSLMFVAGALAAQGSFRLPVPAPVLVAAAIAGDGANYAPFVAALGSMAYPSFLAYNVTGGLAWVGLLLGAGYAFGNQPWVGAHLTLVLLGIVALSLAPGLIAWLRARPAGSSRAATLEETP